MSLRVGSIFSDTTVVEWTLYSNLLYCVGWVTKIAVDILFIFPCNFQVELKREKKTLGKKLQQRKSRTGLKDIILQEQHFNKGYVQKFGCLACLRV